MQEAELLVGLHLLTLTEHNLHNPYTRSVVQLRMASSCIDRAQTDSRHVRPQTNISLPYSLIPSTKHLGTSAWR
jgi:hypothetical protein